MASNSANTFCDEFSTFTEKEFLTLLDSDSDSDLEDDDDAVETNDNELEPKYLAVIAPIEGETESELERNEVNKRKELLKHFLVSHYKGDVGDVDREFLCVRSYEEFQAKLAPFFSGLKSTCLPMVFFLGHGSNKGELCFKKGNKSSRVAFQDIQKSFNDNKPDDVPAHQCRVAFCQCHGHLMDGNNKPDEVQQGEGGIEYIYFSSAEETLTYSQELESNDLFLKLNHHIDATDVYLRPPVTLEIVRSRVADFRKKLREKKKEMDPSAFKRHKKHAAKYHLDRPPENRPDPRQNLPLGMREDLVTWRQENLKMYLQIVIKQKTSATPLGFSDLDKHTDRFFEVVKKNIQSLVEYHQAVKDFLDGRAKDIIMPVILVAGEIVEEGPCNRKLVFSDRTEGVALIDLFRPYVDENGTICTRRMLFEGGGKTFW